MKVNPKMYVIPDKENFILYSPLTGSILEVNTPIVKELQNLSLGKNYHFEKGIEKILENKGFIGKEFPKFENISIPKEYKPTGVTLMPTWDCNLRCRYCYSHGGENPRDLLDVRIAKSSIDFIVKNALDKNSKGISVGYHGGGEPLMHKNMSWIKEITDYSKSKGKENNLKVRISSATNGLLGKKDLEWVINNFDRVNLSWDGTKDIQNFQRPGVNGLGTYDSVLKTAKYFEKMNFPYGIRSTISSKSVGKMEEIVKLFIDETTVKGFHLEPLFECGRGEGDLELRAPSKEDFIENFIKAKKFAQENGRKLYHSASDLKKIGRKFCGAAGTNFFVTPDGNITSCLEVSRPEDDMNEVFLIGNYNERSNSFSFNEDRLDALRKRVVENVEGCSECFAEYNCSGDCLAKAYAVSRDLYDSRNNLRCDTNRALLLHEIKQKLKNSGGFE